jgi:SHAQKYF class myb-like DNA-binding protein
MEVNSHQSNTKRRITKKVAASKSSMCKDGKWSEEEHQRFLEAIEMFGNMWRKVESFIGSRSTAQIRSHAQKHFRRLRCQAICEMKKNNQLQQNVFVVVREFRNNTYNAASQTGEVSTASNSPSKGTEEMQDPNNCSIENESNLTESLPKEAEWKLHDEEVLISQQGDTAFSDNQYKFIMEKAVNQAEEEYDPLFDITLLPSVSNEKAAKIKDFNFALFDEREIKEEHEEEQSRPLLGKVKYEP